MPFIQKSGWFNGHCADWLLIDEMDHSSARCIYLSEMWNWSLE